jgi:hypothetical protein
MLARLWLVFASLTQRQSASESKTVKSHTRMMWRMQAPRNCRDSESPRRGQIPQIPHEARQLALTVPGMADRID